MDSVQTTRARPRPGDELELTIDSLAFGGAGIARSDGYVVFVHGGLPGDRVKVELSPYDLTKGRIVFRQK